MSRSDPASPLRHERYRRRRRLGPASAALLVAAGPGAGWASDDSALARQSAERSVTHLNRVMDAFHDRFPVYDDVSSPGNHFHAYAKIPDENAPVAITGSSEEDPHGGATAIRCELLDLPGASSFGGFYFQNGVLAGTDRAPVPNFGDVPDAGIDLTGATALTFWARRISDHAVVDFFMGGVGRDPVSGQPISPHPSSTPVRKIEGVPLSDGWTQYTIDLTGVDLSYILGGFGWVASLDANPGGAVFELDDIQYELGPTARAARLDEPRLLRSFTTGPTQNDFDRVLRNTAFVYDNALVLLMYLAEGSADSERRARLIGDAFVYAAGHDRHFDDGRLRDAYAAGDLALPPGWTPNGRAGTVPIPGFFSDDDQRFFEVHQEGISVGNNAWAMIALLALQLRTGDTTYLDAARDLGEFIRSFRNDQGTYRGFLGGLDNPEAGPPLPPCTSSDPAAPKVRCWASTEHNLDVYAAFRRMARITGEASWLADAAHARRFVEAMWYTDPQMLDPRDRCFLAGTADPEARNLTPNQLPLDTQSWSALAIPGTLLRFPPVLDCAERNHRVQSGAFPGFDFNDDGDGVWFEGTAQMAAAYAVAARDDLAAPLRAALREAQETPPFGDGEGIAAAERDGISTGFQTPTGQDFLLFRRLHIAATSWNGFAQLSKNPYYVPEPAPAALRAMAGLCVLLLAGLRWVR